MRYETYSEMLAAVQAFEPEAIVTHHAPHGRDAGGYVVHVWGRELSAYFPTRERALADALSHLDASADAPRGCRQPTGVPGTNGGTLPCGSVLRELSGERRRRLCTKCASNDEEWMRGIPLSAEA